MKTAEVKKFAESMRQQFEVKSDNISSTINSFLERFGKGTRQRQERIAAVPAQVQSLEKMAGSRQGAAMGDAAAELAGAAVPGGVLFPQSRTESPQQRTLEFVQGSAPRISQAEMPFFVPPVEDPSAVTTVEASANTATRSAMSTEQSSTTDITNMDE